MDEIISSATKIWSILVQITPVTILWQVYVRITEKKSRKKSLVCALLAEINSLEERWNFSVGGKLKPLDDGEVPPLKIVHIREDYFSIYNNNADKIGTLKPEETSYIVSFYQNAKGFIDTIRTWEKIVDELSKKLREDKRNILSIEEVSILVGYYNMMVFQQDEVFEQGEKVRKCLEQYL